MQGNLLLLLLLAALLLGPSASPAVGASASAFTRRLEDEVAPELSWAAGLLGKGIGESALKPEKPQCVQNCAAKGPGESYTRSCTYEERCRH